MEEIVIWMILIAIALIIVVGVVEWGINLLSKWIHK